jgi:hypothetical protein
LPIQHIAGLLDEVERCDFGHGIGVQETDASTSTSSPTHDLLH